LPAAATGEGGFGGAAAAGDAGPGSPAAAEGGAADGRTAAFRLGGGTMGLGGFGLSGVSGMWGSRRIESVQEARRIHLVGSADQSRVGRG